MSDFLEKILARRRQQVAAERINGSLRSAAEAARAGKPRHRLREALREDSGIHLICEFKRASPSLGWIRENARPSEWTAVYENAGASAISVLTEPNFFHGSLDDLKQVRAATRLPILRKDFVVDEFQIDEAAVAGADAILLIVAALSEDELQRFRTRAEDELALDALVEVHSVEEMERAKNCGAKLIGVNNRDLRTFRTSLETSVQLAALAPAGATLMSESGISSPEQIRTLRGCGYRGFLIGESLMRADDPAELIQNLRGDVVVKICGLTNVSDALACAEAGASFLGLNFSPRSPRCISVSAAREIVAAVRSKFPKVKIVGVFVDQEPSFVQTVADDLALDAIQLHGDESAESMRELRAPMRIKALRVQSEIPAVTNYDCDAILLDTWHASRHGGTGETFPWEIAAKFPQDGCRLILAGGLTSENVAEAVRRVRPFAVDVCSGVESRPGEKDRAKVEKFIAACR